MLSEEKRIKAIRQTQLVYSMCIRQNVFPSALQQIEHLHDVLADFDEQPVTFRFRREVINEHILHICDDFHSDDQGDDADLVCNREEQMCMNCGAVEFNAPCHNVKGVCLECKRHVGKCICDVPSLYYRRVPE